MKGVLEHCTEMVHGSSLLDGSWNIVMTRVSEHCDDGVLEHCNSRGDGAL